MNDDLTIQQEEQPVQPQKARVKMWKPIALIVVLCILMFLAWYFNLGSKMKNLKGFIDGLGVWGPLVFGLIYMGGVIAMIPGAALTFIAGAIFGSLWGTIIVSLSSTAGASICFLIARYVARDAVSAWVSGSEKFSRLDELTYTHGGWMVAITRFVPLFPFNLINYGFGLTRVNFLTYVFLSWVCMLPGTVMYVVGADAVTKAFTQGRVPIELILLFVGVIVILTVIARFARAKLRQAEQETPSAQTTTKEEPAE